MWGWGLWLDTRDTPAAPRWPGRGEGAAVKAGDLRAELVILFVSANSSESHYLLLF